MLRVGRAPLRSAITTGGHSILLGELREGFILWCPERGEFWPLSRELFKSFLEDRFFIGRWIGERPRDCEALQERLKIIAMRNHTKELNVFNPRAWRAIESCYL